GILESAASLGMKIIEIPTNPQSGMDLNQLEAAIRKHRVKACVVMTNSHNPLGYVLPDHYKKALVDVTARWNVPLIEDDTYGDLEIFSSRHADQPPVRRLHAVDRVPAANQCPQAVSRRLGGKHQHPAGNYLFSNWAIQESHSD